MRARVLLALTILGLVIASPALAADDAAPAFPDLPGMGLAEDATKGEVAPSQASHHGDTGGGTGTSGAPDAKAADTQAPDPTLIRELPGTGPIPVISTDDAGLASSTSRGRSEPDTMPRGLAAAAAIGTIVAVGSFLVFRDRLV